MPPLIVSVVTDSLGFVIILFTPFSNLMNMAIGSAVGLISMLYLVIFAVPAVATFWKAPSEKAIEMAKKETMGEEKSFLGKLLGKGARARFWCLALAAFCSPGGSGRDRNGISL